MTIKDKLICCFIQPFSLSLILLFTAFSPTVHGQITTGNINPDEEKKEEKVSKRDTRKEVSDSSFAPQDSLTGTNFYLSGFYQYGYRTFKDESVNGYYKEWEDQTADYTGGFSLGLLMDLTDHISFEIGYSYFTNGENYSFADSLTDSTYTYNRIYRQMALPIRVRYTYGNDLQFYGFFGMVPLNILKLSYDAKFANESGEITDLDPVIVKDGFSTFNVMVSAGFGLQYNLPHLGFFIAPEYRYHLLNTYAEKVINMNHHLFGIALNAGLVLRY